MKKTLFALLALAGVACGASYNFATTFTNGTEYKANEGGGYVGIAFNLKDTSDRYSLPEGFADDDGVLTLNSITVTARYQRTIEATTGIILTTASGEVIGLAGSNTQMSTNQGIISGYTRTYVTFTFTEGVSIDRNEEYYAYFSDSGKLATLMDAMNESPITLTSANFATYANKSEQLAMTQPTSGSYSNTANTEWNAVSGYNTISATSYAPAMSIGVTSIPEPATATLSLLALAGLAARRRRH